MDRDGRKARKTVKERDVGSDTHDDRGRLSTLLAPSLFYLVNRDPEYRSFIVFVLNLDFDKRKGVPTPRHRPPAPPTKETGGPSLDKVER